MGRNSLTETPQPGALRLASRRWRGGDTLGGGRDAARIGLGSLSGGADHGAIDATALAEFGARSARQQLRSVDGTGSLDESLHMLGNALGLAVPVLAGELEGTELRFRRSGSVNHQLYREEQSALEWAVRAPNLARLNPLFSELAGMTPEKALRERLKPARRV